MILSLPPDVERILSILQVSGHEAVLVGGCVRDAVLGISPHDWDIACSAKPDALKAALPDFRIRDTGIRHQTVSVLLHGKAYEITTYRAPDHQPASLQTDLSMRDFTMNAMAYSPVLGFIDPFGGENDLNAKIIRCVGSPDARFSEDALRVLRAVRFSAKFGFSIESEMQAAMPRFLSALQKTAVERQGAELRALLAGCHAPRALRENPAVLQAVVPALSTQAIFSAADRFAAAQPYEPDEILRSAFFFLSLDAESAYAEMTRLRFSHQLAGEAAQLIRYAFTPLEVSRSQVCRWLSLLHQKQLFRLLRLQSCLSGANLDELAAFYACVQDTLSSGRAYSLKTLAISGNDLLAIGVNSGKEVGALLAQLLEDVIEGRVPNEKGALLERARKFYANFK